MDSLCVHHLVKWDIYQIWAPILHLVFPRKQGLGKWGPSKDSLVIAKGEVRLGFLYKRHGVVLRLIILPFYMECN